MGEMRYNTMCNVGKCKYLVNYHNGTSTHRDGSDFFDIAIFSNKRKRDAFIRELRNSGYVARMR